MLLRIVYILLIVRKVEESQATVRFETNVSTTIVEFGAASDRQAPIVGDESEKNVDSPNNGLRAFKYSESASVKRIIQLSFTYSS